MGFYKWLAFAVFAALTPHRQPNAKKWASPFFGYAHPPPFGLANLDSSVILRNFDFCAFGQFVKTSGTFGFAHFDNLAKTSLDFDFVHFDCFVKYLKWIFQISAVLSLPSPNKGFGVRRGAVSWDTSQDFGSFAPVRAFAKPRPTPSPRHVARKRSADITVYFDSVYFYNLVGFD